MTAKLEKVSQKASLILSVYHNFDRNKTRLENGQSMPQPLPPPPPNADTKKCFETFDYENLNHSPKHQLSSWV